jgi:hypothetical protein
MHCGRPRYRPDTQWRQSSTGHPFQGQLLSGAPVNWRTPLMEQDLLYCLLAAFPADDELVISGYRLPFEAATDDSLISLVTKRHGDGISPDAWIAFDRG